VNPTVPEIPAWINHLLKTGEAPEGMSPADIVRGLVESAVTFIDMGS
jgi:hypothetical protein